MDNVRITLADTPDTGTVPSASVDLTEATDFGFFVVTGDTGDSDTFYIASFTTDTTDSDIVVGEILTRRKGYTALGRQHITVDSGEENVGGAWSVNGSDFGDQITVLSDNATINAGNGENTIGNSGNFVLINGGSGADSIEIGCSDVTVSAGAGNDSINIKSGARHFVEGGDDADEFIISGATTLTFGDLDVNEDSLTFGEDMPVNSFDYTEDESGVTLKSDSLEIIFSNTTLAQLRNYTITNGNSQISLARLIASTITICTFLTLTSAFKQFDVNMALTNGTGSVQNFMGNYLTNGTQMLALNIYNTAISKNSYALGQAKAVLFFVILACVSLVQVRISNSKEVEL